MKLLPVAGREQRVASRRKGTFVVRLATAGLGILSAALVLLAMVGMGPTDQGRVLFVALAVPAFAYCLFCGAVTTADSVSEEKRDGTLGLLFLTDLRGYDVVGGKLAATSLRVVSALVALIPVLALPLMLGGVSGELVGLTALVLGNTLFLSLALGMLVSAGTREARAAVAWTLSLLCTLTILLPFAEWLIVEWAFRRGTPAVRIREVVLSINPIALFSDTLAGLVRGAGATPTFWRNLAVQHGLAWFALASACWLLPRSWQDRAEPAPRARPLVHSRHAEAARRQERAEVLDLHPFAWYVARDRRSTRVAWLGLGLLAAGWAWGFAELGAEWLVGTVGAGTTFAAGVWLKLRLATASCRHLLEHRQSGALELVLCAPLTPVEFLRGHLVGLRLSFLPLLATVLAGAGLLLVGAVGQDRDPTSAAAWVGLFGAGLLVLVVDLWTIAWTGMWRGLVTGRYVRAYAVTLGLVLALPWVIFCLSLIVLAILTETMQLSPSFEPGFPGLLAWWTFLALGVDAVLLGRSREGLRRWFENLAAGSLVRPPRGTGAGGGPRGKAL